MSMDAPTTVREWKRYISKLHGTQLRSKAMAANSRDFVEQLQAEGYKPREISDIIDMFVVQFIADDQEIPGRVPGSYMNLRDVANRLAQEGRLAR